MEQTNELEITKAPAAEKTLIAGLMQKYLSELSPHTGQKPEGTGRFRYPYLESYWNELERTPYLIQVGRRPIGFAFVRTVTGGTMMSEFFIDAHHRRHGYGRTAAHRVFAEFPGKWAVRELITNAKAQAFWRSVIKDIDPKYSERIEITQDGRSWTVQRFTA